ncbi:MAG: XdhC family protein [Candidatus Hodarchaeales archaeon]
MIALTEDQQPFALVTVIRAVGSTPRKVGAKMLVGAKGQLLWGTVGGGAIENQILQAIPGILAEGKPQTLSYSLASPRGASDEMVETGMICGGEMDVFVEPSGSQDPLVIFGGGHIAQALVPIAKQLDFRIIVVDDREEFANQERFPEADEIIQGSFPQIFEKIPFSDRAFIVIITYSHQLDEEALRGCLVQPWRYLGMIASKRKTAEVFGRLLSEGISKDILDRIHSPIGLPKEFLPVETPEEIAVSIAAELIQVRKGEER